MDEHDSAGADRCTQNTASYDSIANSSCRAIAGAPDDFARRCQPQKFCCFCSERSGDLVTLDHRW